MNLVQRVRSILLEPKATWPVIEPEPADAAGLYTAAGGVVGIVLSIVLGTITGPLLPSPTTMDGMPGAGTGP